MVAPLVDCWESVLRGQRDDALPIPIECDRALYEDCVGLPGPHSCKRLVVVASLDFDDDQLDTESRRGSLRLLHSSLQAWLGRADKEADPGGPWYRFFKQLQPLGFVATPHPVRHSGDVSARRSKALNESEADRIRGEPHDDRNRLGCVSSGPDPSRPDCDDGVRTKLDQLAGQRREPVNLALSVSLLDDEVPAFAIAQLAESLQNHDH
jgi:hypothetical protein